MSREASKSRRFGNLSLTMILLAFGITPTANSAEPVKSIRNAKDYDQVRSRAKTVDEFHALAAYCRARVSKYEADKEKNQAELDQYNSKQHIANSNPKFRSKDDLLKSYIARDEKAIARWTELGAQYSDRAHKNGDRESTAVAPG
jgi:hypothetical protein